MKTRSDIQLLEALKSDDYQAFNTIYDRYWERLYRFAFKLTKERELAIQITQDVFVQLWDSRESQEIRKLDAYMFQAVKYRFFQIYRSHSHKMVSLSREFQEYLVDHLPVMIADQNELVEEALELLPHKKKEILLMNIFQDMKPDEIARALGISTQTVRNQLSAALKQLRIYFKDREVEFFVLMIVALNHFT